MVNPRTFIIIASICTFSCSSNTNFPVSVEQRADDLEAELKAACPKLDILRLGKGGVLNKRELLRAVRDVTIKVLLLNFIYFILFLFSVSYGNE
jgi:hypothetical protein